MNTKPPRKRLLSSLHPVILILAVILLSGCSKPIDKAIIGKWREEGKTGEFFEFSHDNTLLIHTDKEQLSGRWTKVSDNRIKADFSMLGATVPIVFEDIEISGNKMTVTLNGEKGTLNREK